MPLAADLARLSEKHRQLELKIREEMAHPGADETRIVQWKREKLRLKDEMAKLQRTNGQFRH
jgi:hypothetical protein